MHFNKTFKRVMALVFISFGLAGCGTNQEQASSETTSFKRKFTNVIYSTDSKNKNLLDVVLPSKGTDDFPLVVFVHGGAWYSLNRNYGVLETLLKSLRENSGFATAYVDYTLDKIAMPETGYAYATESNYPQMLYDIKCAIRHLKANASTYHIDTKNIFLLGESAGAHLSMMAGATMGNMDFEDMSMGYSDQNSDVAGVLSFFGPTFFDTEDEYTIQYMDIMFGYDYTEEQWKSVSPYYNVTDKMCPLFLTHGRNDTSVPFVNSEKMEEKTKSLIGEDKVTTYYMDDAPHADRTAYNSQPVIEQVSSFLNKWKAK